MEGGGGCRSWSWTATSGEERCGNLRPWTRGTHAYAWFASLATLGSLRQPPLRRAGSLAGGRRECECGEHGGDGAPAGPQQLLGRLLRPPRSRGIFVQMYLFDDPLPARIVVVHVAILLKMTDLTKLTDHTDLILVFCFFIPTVFGSCRQLQTLATFILK